MRELPQPYPCQSFHQDQILENWFRAKYSQTEIEYELGKLGETWAKYQAGILAMGSWLPAPAAATITFLVDLITSSIKKLKESL